jgi:hypothetical protein
VTDDPIKLDRNSLLALGFVCLTIVLVAVIIAWAVRA